MNRANSDEASVANGLSTKKLSSATTTFHKIVYPTIGYSIMGLMLITVLLNASWQGGRILLALGAIAGMTALMHYFNRKLVFDLADTVYIRGTRLLFIKGPTEVVVELKDVRNISYTALVYPPRCTVKLAHQTALGDELTFSPRGLFQFFIKNRDVVELIDAVDAARSNR